MKVALAFGGVVAAVPQQPTFEQWASKYGINGDEVTRATYLDNVKFIDELNARDDSAAYTVNKFSGMTFEEFAAIYLTVKPYAFTTSDLPVLEAMTGDAVTDDGVDWDTTPVKDQGQCGSCWAFSTIGTIEGINKIMTGQEVILAEQQLIDCDRSGMDSGCSGGLPEEGYKFLTDKDTYTLDSYPYDSYSGSDSFSCRTKTATPSGVMVSGYHAVDKDKGDQALAVALMGGVVAITIAADGQFSGYSGGVMTGVPTTCSINHAIIATGYGPNFWKIKNSWGTGWGEQGYAKFERTTSGCGPFGLFYQDAGMQPILVQPPRPTPTPSPQPTPPPSPMPTPPPSPQPTPPPTPRPTPPPTPPPSPPTPSHYGAPPCQSDEQELSLSGYSLSVCTKKCFSTSDCPTDVPSGTSAVPSCFGLFCGLQCSSDVECPPGGSCMYQQCWYPVASAITV